MATLENLLSDLEAADGVLAASYSNPQLVGQNLNDVWTTDFVYAEEEGAIANIKKHRAIAFGAISATADAYWLGSLPEPLRTDPPVVYFADRTASSITAAQIETFCNATWKALPNQSGAPDLREFSVVPSDGKTVRIECHTNTGAAGALWKPKKYFIRLVDPNGSVTVGNANIKFEEIE